MILPGHPLADKRVLLTRPRPQAAVTAAEVRRLGGIPILFPCLEVHCARDAIRAAVPLLERCADAAVLFTSANGVACVAGALGGRFVELMHDRPVAAVGRRTAAALTTRGVRVDIVPDDFSQEGLLARLRRDPPPARIIFFRAEEGRDLLVRELEALGVPVELVAAYRADCPADGAREAEVAALLRRGAIDAVLLGSSRTAHHYARRLGDAAAAAPVAAISGAVARTAASLGLDVQIVAKEASFASMLEGLARHFAEAPPRETAAEEGEES